MDSIDVVRPKEPIEPITLRSNYCLAFCRLYLLFITIENFTPKSIEVSGGRPDTRY